MTAPWQPTDDQLLCRDLQHSWSPWTAARDGKGFLRVLICDRCRAEKFQYLDRNGYITRSSMVYPTGYLRSGEGRMTRDDRAILRVRNLS